MNFIKELISWLIAAENKYRKRCAKSQPQTNGSSSDHFRFVKERQEFAKGSWTRLARDQRLSGAVTYHHTPNRSGIGLSLEKATAAAAAAASVVSLVGSRRLCVETRHYSTTAHALKPIAVDSRGDPDRNISSPSPTLWPSSTSSAAATI